MSLLNYFSHYFYNSDDQNKNQDQEISDNIYLEYDIINIDKKFIVSLNDIKSVNLQPVKPNLNKPKQQNNKFEKVNMRCLNKSQLDAIMNVKLKHIEINNENKVYEHRHPVLKELLDKTNRK